MTMSKESQRVEQELTKLGNQLATLEAKLDGLMKNNMKEEDIRKIKLPEPRKIEKISSAAPYTIKGDPNTMNTAEEGSTEVDPTLSTITPPAVPPPAGQEPVPGYDKLTEGEVLKLVKSGLPQEQLMAILNYEKAHKNRERVTEAAEAEIVALVEKQGESATNTVDDSTEPSEPSQQPASRIPSQSSSASTPPPSPTSTTGKIT